MVSTGKFSLYNGYLPGDKQKARLPRPIEDVWKEIAEEDFPEGRYYLILEVAGSIKDSGEDFQMPPIKYCFKPRDA